MASLQNEQINLSYQGIIKTADNAAVGATAKAITDGAGNATNIEMSNTATNFVSGTVDFTGSTVSGLPGGADTTYDLGSAQSTNDVDVTLTGSDATVDTIKMVAGTNITLTDNGSNQITIDAAGGAAGLVAGAGTDSMKSADSLTTNANIASGINSISIGNGNTVDVDNSIAIGDNLVNSGQGDTIMMGKNWNQTFGDNSVFIGTPASTLPVGQNDIICIGAVANADSKGGIAIGTNAEVEGKSNGFSIAVGYGARAGTDANTDNCISIGYLSLASISGATALGANVTAAIADTVSIKALEVQTDSTPTTGGIIMSDAGGTDRRINIDATGGLQIDSTPVGGGGGDAFSPISLSGTSQTLDLSQYNFGDGGELSGNTTLAFSNVPTEKSFQYSYTVGDAPFALDGASFTGVSKGISPANTLSGFSYDGTRMWALKGDTSGDALYQWNLSTAWDINTATYSGTSFNLESQDNQVGPQMYFKQDGTSFWLVGIQNKNVVQYNMSTANDLSTATYSGSSFSISAQEAQPRAVWFKPDGTKFFVAGTSDIVFSYSMTTAFDLSTASYDNVSFSMVAQDGMTEGLAFDEDGTKFYQVGNTSKKIFEYNLSTAWDLSTASYNNISFSTELNSPRSIAYKSDGTQFFISDYIATTVYSIDAGVTKLTLPASVQNTPTLEFKKGDVVTQNFYTLDGGVKVYYEEEPTDAAAAPGIIAGSGVDSIASSGAVNSSPAAANGTEAIAIGNEATALAANNVSIGATCKSDGTNIINIGDNNNATGTGVSNSILIRPGGGTGLAFRGGSVTIGVGAYPGDDAVAIGLNAQSGQNAENVIIGKSTDARGDGVAIGHNADANGDSCVSVGANSEASVAGAICIGDGLASATNAVALGNNITAATADTVTIKKLQILDYATIEFADDTAAATGGIPLGGVYHTSGALKIRIV